jgi:hypothetical protein
MEKPDRHGEWVLHQNNKAEGGSTHPSDEVLLAAARAAWPRVLAHAKRELEQKNSSRETEAVVAEVWEAVLKSVSRALRRRGHNSSRVRQGPRLLVQRSAAQRDEGLRRIRGQLPRESTAMP